MSDTDPKVLKVERVALMMSADELRAIDDFRFARRLRSRAEAIRQLCQASLAPAPVVADPPDEEDPPHENDGKPFRWVPQEHGGTYAYAGSHIIGFVTGTRADGTHAWVLTAVKANDHDPAIKGTSRSPELASRALRRAWLRWLSERAASPV